MKMKDMNYRFRQKKFKEYWMNKGFSEKDAIEKAKKVYDESKYNTKKNKLYWMKNGYTEEQAILKTREFKKPFKEYWIKRGYSEEDAIQRAKESCATFKEYWIKRGYSEEDAIQKSKERRTGTKEYYLAKNKTYDDAIKLEETYRKNISKDNKEYWINKGYTEEQANFEVRSLKAYNKEYWIKRGYSEEDAIKLSKNTNPTYKGYWIARGYTEEQAIVKIKERKKTCIEYWLKNGYTEEQARIMANKEASESCQLNIAYWLKRGYSEQEAKSKLDVLLKEKSEIFKKNFKRSFNRLTKDYWLKRGYTEEDAIKMAIGTNREMTKNIPHDVRSNASRKANASIPKDRKIHINQKISEILKAKHGTHTPLSKNYWLNKGYSLEQARELSSKARFSPSKHNYTSKMETKCFNELQKYLNIKIIRQKWVQIKEFVFCQDGRYKNIVFEFNGTNFHLDDRFHGENSKSPYGKDYKTVKEHDKLKLDSYKKKGYNTIVIWEYDYRKNKELLFENIKQLFNSDFINGKSNLWDSSVKFPI